MYGALAARMQVAKRLPTDCEAADQSVSNICKIFTFCDDENNPISSVNLHMDIITNDRSEWRVTPLQLYSQSHIRLFLIIVLKVGKVYSSSSVGCYIYTGLIYLWKPISLAFKQTKKSWLPKTKFWYTRRKQICMPSFGALQIISEILISSISR